jgi:hypothetical protein
VSGAKTLLRGRQAKALTQELIDRLEIYRTKEYLGIPGLRRAMAAPFSASTLRAALLGRKIWMPYYGFLSQWIERHVPQNIRPGSDEETPGAVETSPRRERGGE